MNQTTKPNKDVLRTLVRGGYDIQKLRIEMGNRIVAQFRSRLGIAPGEKEETNEEAMNVLDELRAAFKKITDGVKRELPTKDKFQGDALISDYTELCLLHAYLDLESREASHFRRLEACLDDFQIYTEFLKPIRGCGPAMAGCIISEFDIHKAKYPSSLWAYAGFDVAADSLGRSRRKEHLRRVAYTDKAGKPAERDGITFNPWLKTKLYVLATCFIKVGGKYREIYDGYKHRLENHPKWAERIKGHRHNAAMRYMIKIFLIDLYTAWRAMEGLEVAKPYHEAKLGLKHAA